MPSRARPALRTPTLIILVPSARICHLVPGGQSLITFRPLALPTLDPFAELLQVICHTCVSALLAQLTESGRWRRAGSGSAFATSDHQLQAREGYVVGIAGARERIKFPPAIVKVTQINPAQQRFRGNEVQRRRRLQKLWHEVSASAWSQMDVPIQTLGSGHLRQNFIVP